ncbi:flagellar motor protein MotB [Pontibaca salina]|uniref:Chemotaxis protein MotB n=1 Tax=Pontibaca salina TaxID=2795731 RepID=A0A934HHX0_9RHOB|nr:chemotaxis protein MotB [Pontibaca salina]
MVVSNKAAPVIIKRKKNIVAGGRNGGAWKVAYADFVTAMMAFFMLMWLLNATTEKQRKGLADYFSPTTPISRVSGGGEDAFSGDSIFSEDQLARNGLGATIRNPDNALQARGATGVEQPSQVHSETDPLRMIEEELMGISGESLVAPEMLKHILTRVTDDGLVIELYANDGAPLFQEGTDTPTEMMRDLINIVARAVRKVSNSIAISGHVRAHPIVLAKNPAWPLSLARASRTQRLLGVAGMDPARIKRVSGHADRALTTDNPMSVRNDRIEVTVLRK